MITKHFFKVLTIFAVMIIIGMIGLFVVNSFGRGAEQTTNAGDQN